MKKFSWAEYVLCTVECCTLGGAVGLTSFNTYFYKDGTSPAPPSVHHCLYHIWCTQWSLIQESSGLFLTFSQLNFCQKTYQLHPSISFSPIDLTCPSVLSSKSSTTLNVQKKESQTQFNLNFKKRIWFFKNLKSRSFIEI